MHPSLFPFSELQWSIDPKAAGVSTTFALHLAFSLVRSCRFLSLADKGGPDDLFSSDFSDDELAQKLGHMKGTKTLVRSLYSTVHDCLRIVLISTALCWSALYDSSVLCGALMF